MMLIKSTFKYGPKIKVHITLEKSKIQSIVFKQKDISFNIEISLQEHQPSLVEAVTNWFHNYSKKEKENISLPIDLSQFTPFEKKVYHALLKTKLSQTYSYKELAEKIGHPKAHRAVGTACGKNLFPLYIPCHRVILSNGRLGKFALSTEIKEQLLNFESL